MGSGKSTAIEALKAHGIGAVALTKFAGPLYAMQQMIYRIIQPVYQPPTDFVKDRKLLQWLGTDWGRDSISKTLWVDLWKAGVAKVSERDPEVVVACDDVRFDNEADAVHACGGIVVRIESTRCQDRATGGVGITGHASEGGIAGEKIDYLIRNDGTEEEYRETLRTLFAQIMTDQGL